MLLSRIVAVGKKCALSSRSSWCVLLLCAWVSSAGAGDNSHLQLRVWRRVVGERKQTMIRFETGKADERFIEVTHSLFQEKISLELQKISLAPDGTTRWKATVRQFSFSDDEGEPSLPADWPAKMRREQRERRLGVASEIQKLAGRLAGTTFEITQAKDSEIKGVGIADLLRRLPIELKRTPAKLRGEVASQLEPLANAEHWLYLLTAQSPRLPASREVGNQWAFAPAPLLRIVKSSGGTSRIESVEGEGDSAQTSVVSTAKIDFNPQPSRAINTSEYVLELHGAIQAQTKFGVRSLWPLEHQATERGHAIYRIYITDKQGHGGLVDETPSDYEMQSRLVCEPAKP